MRTVGRACPSTNFGMSSVAAPPTSRQRRSASGFRPRGDLSMFVSSSAKIGHRCRYCQAAARSPVLVGSGSLAPPTEPAMIHVVAIVTAKPGKRGEILRHFVANVPACRAEKGCIEYGPVVAAANAPASQTKVGPDTFLVVENW